MSDLAIGLGFAGSQLESFGQALIGRFGPLNLWTAALLTRRPPRNRHCPTRTW